VAVRVHDAYLGGEGVLLASLGGLITLAYLRGGGDLAQGELMRFLAEAAWYPTALLPSQGVRWQAIDDRSARATLTDRGVEAMLLFSFGADGLLERVNAEARARTVGRGTVATPWQGRFWDYQERSGILVPLEAEVAWLLPEGPRAYWRGRIEEIEYELSG
jgi:hypothetical protein